VSDSSGRRRLGDGGPLELESEPPGRRKRRRREKREKSGGDGEETRERECRKEELERCWV